MEIESNENIVCVDIDDTLVMWEWPKEREHEVMEFNNHDIYTERLVPNTYNIALMKKFKASGWKVIAWSQNGPRWVKEVISKLGLESFVDHGMVKPKWIIDDLPPTAWTDRAHFTLAGGQSKGTMQVQFCNDEE